MKIEEMKQLFLQSKGIKKQLEMNLQDEKNNLSEYQEQLKLLEQAQVFLQKIAQDTQSELKFKIEDIVNLALETCFPNEYIFQLQFNISRGKTDAELVFSSQKSGRQIDPMNASGGGVVDLTAFALRIASFAIEPNIDNVIILDEPFRFISKDLQNRAGEILKTLSEKMNLQIIMVTHSNELIDIADRVFEVRKNNDGKSIIKAS